MTIFSMRCPRCGLIQAQAPTCKSCGAAAGGSNFPSDKRRVETANAPIPSPSSASPSTAASWGPGSLGSEAGEHRRLYFRGNAGSLFGIHIINILLTLVTLGIYSFWAKVKMRKYLLSQTEFERDRFAYHGTGKELLEGSLKAGLVFGLPVTLLNTLPKFLGAGTVIKIIAGILLYCIVMVFIPFAIVGTRRYRLSRTSWRGIRFSFRGQVVDFIKLYISGSVLTVLTLGLYYPFFSVKQYGFLASHSYFGNQRFHFDGNGRELCSSYLRALLLTIPTLGVYWFWFYSKKQRYLTEHTAFVTACFNSTVTGGGLGLLVLINSLLLVGTLGLALPWVSVRTMRFWFDNVSLEGPLDVTTIQQDAQSASATGEGLAGFLDLDFGLGG